MGTSCRLCVVVGRGGVLFGLRLGVFRLLLRPILVGLALAHLSHFRGYLSTDWHNIGINIFYWIEAMSTGRWRAVTSRICRGGVELSPGDRQ